MSPEARRPAAAGDRGGFASFFEANNDTLLRFIIRSGVPAADAEHVNQETWLSLLSYWEKRGAPEGYDDGDQQHARNLMYLTARNRIADYWRDASRRPAQTALDPNVHDQLDWTSAEQCDGILEYLTRQDTRPVLTRRQETALRLVYLEGCSQQEAAALMGITLNALEKLLKRAKEAIEQVQQATTTKTEEGTR